MQNSKVLTRNKQLLQPFYLGAGRPTMPLERSRNASAKLKGDPASAEVSYYPVPGPGRWVPATRG